MPQRRRKLGRGEAGSLYNDTGKHGLKDMLIGMYGGVEANPEFGLTEMPRPANDPNLIGPMPATTTPNALYKPRTVFDRNETGRLNAARVADIDESARADASEQAMENFLSNLRVKEFETMTPKVTGREQISEDIKRKSAEQQAITTGDAAVLQRNNILAKPPGNALEFQALLKDPMIRKLLADVAKQTQEAKTAEQTAQETSDLGVLTQPSRFKTAELLGELNNTKTQGAIDVFPKEQADFLSELSTRPAERQKKLMEGRLVPVNGGLYDTFEQRFLVQPKPDEIAIQDARMKAIKNGGGITKNSAGVNDAVAPAPEQLRPKTKLYSNQLIIDPATGEILGIDETKQRQ